MLTLRGCAVIGVLTEDIAVRPVLNSLDQHLYVLSTLAFALIIQQVTAIHWSTEPQPFPASSRMRRVGLGDEKFWLPLVTCALAIVGLEYLYRRTLLGRASWPSPRINSRRGAGPAEARTARRELRHGRRNRWPCGLFRRRLLLAFFANGGTSTSTDSFLSPSEASATTAARSSAG